MCRNEMHRGSDAVLGKRVDDVVAMGAGRTDQSHDVEMPRMYARRRARWKLERGQAHKMFVVAGGNRGAPPLPFPEVQQLTTADSRVHVAQIGLDAIRFYGVPPRTAGQVSRPGILRHAVQPSTSHESG